MTYMIKVKTESGDEHFFGPWETLPNEDEINKEVFKTLYYEIKEWVIEFGSNMEWAEENIKEALEMANIYPEEVWVDLPKKE